MKKRTKKEHQITNSYSFNKATTPYPESAPDKVKPPSGEEYGESQIQGKKEQSLDEQAQQYMDAYRKAERVVVINFYTGGGIYKRGILDAIYRGFNPLNP